MLELYDMYFYFKIELRLIGILWIMRVKPFCFWTLLQTSFVTAQMQKAYQLRLISFSFLVTLKGLPPAIP